MPPRRTRTPRKRQLRERIHELEAELRRRKTTRPAPQPGGRPPKGLMWDGWGVDAAGQPNGCFVNTDGEFVELFGLRPVARRVEPFGLRPEEVGKYTATN